jgi:anti-sigma regulatory factor (Ser/Thr protein kinase)
LDSAGLEEVRQFAAGPRAPTAARRFVVDTLKQWGRGEYVNDAALIVTELATNAVIHAQSNFSVAVTSPSGGVRVAVGDASRVAPILGDMASTTATSGRGVALMAALAHQWGTDLTSDGKVVWAEFRRGLAP